MNTDFDAIELALDELDSINLYKEWTRDESDKDIISDEVYLARVALERLRSQIE